MDITDWDNPDPGSVYTPTSDAEWESALSKYLNSGNDRPLRRCVQIARANGATSLVVETRYLDLDYRSQYSAYFARLFAPVPDSCHRLHFFKKTLTSDQLWDLPDDHGYLGYVVIRPIQNGPVSRAMLQPPDDVLPAIQTRVTETITFFGQSLPVVGVPFAQQDTQFGACAHVAAWMCYQAACLRGDAWRRPVADFSLLANTSFYLGRVLPSGGLNAFQLSDLFRTFQLPAIYYQLGSLPKERLAWQPAPPTAPAPHPGQPDPHPGTWDHGIIPIICRYLNSGIPVLIGTTDHAFVICGYRRDNANPTWIEFFRQDDQRGPYLPVGNILNDVDPIWGYQHKPWSSMHVPLPERIFLLPEAAERSGGMWLTSVSSSIALNVAANVYGAPVESLDDLIAGGHLSLKTYVLRSNKFKESLPSRGLPREIVSAYRLNRLPRYVWIVEAVDKRLRAAGQDSVLGHAVFDATSDDIQPRLLCLDVHGVCWVWKTSGKSEGPTVGVTGPYRSGAVGAP